MIPDTCDKRFRHTQGEAWDEATCFLFPSPFLFAFRWRLGSSIVFERYHKKDHGNLKLARGNLAYIVYSILGWFCPKRLITNINLVFFTHKKDIWRQTVLRVA